MTTDPLLERLGGLRWPRPALDHPDPAPGQLWRASWNDTVCLVVVLAPTLGRTVLVAAAGDDEVGDELTVLASTVHDLSPAVWAGVTANIKTFTLEHRLSDLTSDSLASLRQAAGGHRPGTWARISSDLDDRVLVRAELAGRLEELAEAEWLPADASEAPTLAQLATVRGLAASQLADELGVTPGDARRLLQAKREPTAAELQKLTELLGAAPASATQFDEALVASLDHPGFRPRLQLLASTEHHDDEVVARRVLAEQMMALAARQRSPGQRDWTALIRHSFGED